MEREHLKSRMGFILISAGCAIGLGNIWKFPWMTGANGGGLFVLIYLVFLLILGLPVLVAEFTMGRAAQTSPSKVYNTLTPGSKWNLHTILLFLGPIVLMMFYMVVAGWMVKYFVDTCSGALVGLDSAGIGDAFGSMLGDPTILCVFTFIVILLAVVLCSFKIQGGLERVTKIMMTLLLILIVILAVHSLTLPGAAEGLSFYLVPNIDNFTSVGVTNVLVAAMSQAFFTLSIGIGSMMIFGSYIGKERSILGESSRIIVLDTFVAIMAGIIIFPACMTYDVAVGAGPGLIFQTLPLVFNNMPAGQLWGALFFLFMSFAALSTVFAVFEEIVANVMERVDWSRPKTCIICGVGMVLLTLPCILGFNILAGFEPLGPGSGVLDLEDFFVSNIFLPLGALIFVIYCSSRYGWGWDKFMEEANAGEGAKFPQWIRPYFSYVLPVIIFVLLVISITSVF